MNVLSHILVLTIRIYRWTIAPTQRFLFGPGAGCRFTPTCSEYSRDAIILHGAVTGSVLAARRICRCHPWGGYGHDPVPPVASSTASADLLLKDFHG